MKHEKKSYFFGNRNKLRRNCCINCSWKGVMELVKYYQMLFQVKLNEHKEFGGVVPEIAARAHVEKIEFIIKKAIKESNFRFK